MALLFGGALCFLFGAQIIVIVIPAGTTEKGRRRAGTQPPALLIEDNTTKLYGNGNPKERKGRAHLIWGIPVAHVLIQLVLRLLMYPVAETVVLYMPQHEITEERFQDTHP